jgi:hypothetical protein
MKRLTPFAVLLMIAVAARAEDAKPAAAAKQLAQKTADAMVKGDHATVIDNTYPKVIEMMGGRDSAIKTVDSVMKSMAEQGMSITSYTVDEPGQPATEGAHTFAIIPVRMELKSPKGKIAMKSYLLGISADAGKTWKLVDGSGLAEKSVRDMVLPKLPAALKLPEPQQPEVTPNK